MLITPDQLLIFGQLALAVFLGSVIGIERTLAHSLAGFRTFAMVSLGSCVFTIISNIAYASFTDGGTADPLRIASQIVVGVGFLAGGLVVLNKDRNHGLTTSAGLWVAAGIGMAVGFGLYAIAIFVTILALLIFGLFWHLERKIVAEERHRE
jgi:putative Mg2+ transporter-C (MgtC) family protein